MRFLHTADLHRGAPSAHPIYTSRTIPELVNLAVRKRCKYILVAGDIFDKPKPDQKVKDHLVRQVLDARDSVTFIFAPGNHDYTTKSMDYHSLQYLHYLREASNYRINIQVVEPGTYMTFPGLSVYTMQDWGDIALAARENDGSKPLVLVWHGIVPGLQFSDITKVPTESTKEIGEMLRKANAQYLALGDIHRPIKLHKRCWYPGPPVQKSYADKDCVLYVTVTLSSIIVKKHRLPLPKKITIPLEFVEGRDTEEGIIEFVKENVPSGNFLKLKFELPLSSWSALNKKRIQEGLRKHLRELKLDNDPISEQRPRKIAARVAKAKSIKQELNIVIEEEEFGLDKKKLKKVCNRYV